MVISTCVKIQNFHMVLSALMMSFLIFLPLLEFSAAFQSISLTPAGEHFYRKSIIIRSDLEQLIRETKRLDADDSYTLRLGCYKGYHGGEFSEAIARFSEKYPKVLVCTVITGLRILCKKRG